MLPVKLRVLVSFHWMRIYKAPFDEWLGSVFGDVTPTVFMDSGAFSANNAIGKQRQNNRPLTLPDYAQFLSQNHDRIDLYANLDVIDDPEATRRNQKRLEALGLSPLPVYHIGEPWDVLRDYCADGYDYIGLGGVQSVKPNVALPWVLKCIRVAKQAVGRAPAFHGFAATSIRILRALPWYSVDSTSWMRGAQWGLLDLFDEHKGGFVRSTVGNHGKTYSIAPLIRSYGYDPAVFAQPNRGEEYRRATLGIHVRSWLRCEKYLRQFHGPINHATRDDGLLLYLAGRPEDYWRVVQSLESGPPVLADDAFMVRSNDSHSVLAR